MQSNYNNRDFEQFVKQNADQYRMFPSEKVWKGVYSALHTRRRWYSIGLALLLLLTAGTVTWVMISSSTSSKQIGNTKSLIASKDNSSADQQPASKTALSPQLPKSNSTAAVNSLAKTDNSSSSVFDVVTPLVVNRSSDVVEAPVVITTESPATTTQTQPSTSTDVAVTRPVEETSHTIINTIKPVAKIDINSPVIDNDPGMPEAVVTKKQEPVLTEKKAEVYPLGIESVINSFQAGKKKNKLSVQLYFTPTISYRKLRENKSYLNSPAFAGRGLNTNLASLTDVNSVVTHKPDIGLELGAAAGYQVNSKLKLKAGLQFNISRYDIKAFVYNGEVVTIALSNGMDSVKAFSNHGNLGGYTPDWLQNLYFSVSAPLGAELKLSDNGKTHTGIAASLQPTYILGDRAYLISTDYKNYAEIPGLVRHLNLNTSFEAFIAYSTGKLKWQVGPQFRYQVFSSFKQKYPVRENLFDFGLKVGIMLNR